MFTNITSGTIARTLILLLALVNQVLSLFGVSPLPIEDSQIEILITTGWTVVASLIAFWQNNSFSTNAIAGDKIVKALDEGKISQEQVDELVK